MSRTYSLLFAVTVLLIVPLFAGALTINPSGNSDEKLKELLTQRRDVLNQRLEILKARHAEGEIQIVPVLMAQNEVLEAELELAVDKQERINALSKRIDVMKQMEETAKKRFDSGVGTDDALLAAKAARLQAEIDLVREEK